MSKKRKEKKIRTSFFFLKPSKEIEKATSKIITTILIFWTFSRLDVLIKNKKCTRNKSLTQTFFFVHILIHQVVNFPRWASWWNGIAQSRVSFPKPSGRSKWLTWRREIWSANSRGTEADSSTISAPKSFTRYFLVIRSEWFVDCVTEMQFSLKLYCLSRCAGNAGQKILQRADY